MKIYIDDEFKCHASNPDGAFREVEADFFEHKCETFIEGYRYVPSGESWTDSNGVVFDGEMITPWMSYPKLDAAQREYERQLIVEYAAALNTVGVET